MKNLKLKELAAFAKKGNKYLPVLQNVYFNGTYAIVTDLETWIYLEFPCAEPCLIPAQTVLNALKLSETISIYGNKINGIPIENTFDPADFPLCPDFGAEFYTDTMPDLSGILHAMSKKDVRPSLLGVCFTPLEGVIVTCDGPRLAKQNGMTKYDAPQSILPGIAANLCKKLKPSSYSLHEKGFALQFSGGFIKAKKIDGKFPDYHRVMREKSTNYCTFSGVFLESLRKAVSISPDKLYTVKLNFNAGIMTTKNSLSFPLGNLSSDGKFFDIEPCFNARYLLDAAECLPDGTWGFDGATNGAIIEGSGRVCVVMPTRF